MLRLLHIISFLGLFMVSVIQSFAQTQLTENYLVTGPWTDYVVPMKYSYSVSNEGERIKNGPITISGGQNEKYGPVTITGKYSLKASAKDDYLNGPMSINATYHGVKQLYRGQQVEDYSYSFSGAFLNGLPNGTFIAKATNFGSSNATYKNGVLVGAYNVNENIDDRILNIKGAFNDKGKMIGEWRIEILGDVSVWEMINGIRVRISSNDQESTPQQIAMAKKYAAGTISEKELEIEGFIPIQDSIRLGDYASDLYFLKFMADWEKLAKCSFNKSYWVKYTYLYNILPFTEQEFEKIKANYKEKGVAPLVVEFDEKAKCYYSYYYVNYGTPSFKLINRRFTEEQLVNIKGAADYYCRNHPISFSDLCHSLRIDDRKVSDINPRYDNLKKTTDLNTSKTMYDLLIKDIEDFELNLKKKLNGREMTPDGLYYIIPYDDSRQPLSFQYFAASSLDEFLALEKDVRDYGDSLKAKIEEAREQERSAIAQAFMEKISGIKKKSSSKVSVQMNTVDMSYGYYERIPKNNLEITSSELADAIAPVQEISLLDIREEPSGYNTYRVTIAFKKKDESVIASMSITQRGSIIYGTIELPEDKLQQIRKNNDTKRAITKMLGF